MISENQRYFVPPLLKEVVLKKDAVVLGSVVGPAAQHCGNARIRRPLNDRVWDFHIEV